MGRSESGAAPQQLGKPGLWSRLSRALRAGVWHQAGQALVVLAAGIGAAQAGRSAAGEVPARLAIRGGRARCSGAGGGRHFKAEGLDVTVDAGNGSGNAVNRVASGAYDMGFADLAALMEFHANQPHRTQQAGVQ